MKKARLVAVLAVLGVVMFAGPRPAASIVTTYIQPPCAEFRELMDQNSRALEPFHDALRLANRRLKAQFGRGPLKGAMMPLDDVRLASAKDAVVTVGHSDSGKGRGFIVEAERRYYVITAAHCLPHLPPAHPGSCLYERTYTNILRSLDTEPTIAAKCLFVDPIADVAILCEPDDQLDLLCDQWEGMSNSRKTAQPCRSVP